MVFFCMFGREKTNSLRKICDQNEELNDLKATEQTMTTVDELSNANDTDVDENISNKEV